jgi:hypothetical protein
MYPLDSENHSTTFFLLAKAVHAFHVLVQHRTGHRHCRETYFSNALVLPHRHRRNPFGPLPEGLCVWALNLKRHETRRHFSVDLGRHIAFKDGAL